MPINLYKRIDPQDLPDITTHHILSYLMLTKCPYTGQKKAQKTIQLDNGTVLQICVQKFDAISIVLGEVSQLMIHNDLSCTRDDHNINNYTSHISFCRLSWKVESI